VIEWREEASEGSAARVIWREWPADGAVVERAARPVPAYYQRLELGSKASCAEIKQAYRRLARRVHPDRQAPNERAEGERRMQQLNEAYAVLGDAVRRAIYDRSHGLARG
jgi:preprotein translocase subunit Sec63